MSTFAKTLELGLQPLSYDLSHTQLVELAAHLELLQVWQKTFNLTAVPEQDWVIRHVLDSLVLLPFLSEGRWLDVGSGAGFPGIPLAIAAPKLDWVLLDSRLKKVRFLQTVKTQLALDHVEPICERAENYQSSQDFTGIVSRACAEPKKILDMTAHLLAPQGRWVLMLGQAPEELPRVENMTIKLKKVDVPGQQAQRHVLEVTRAL